MSEPVWSRLDAEDADLIRLAVVGAGVMGSHHARIASRLPGAQLCWVVDPDTDRASALAPQCGAEAAAQLDDALATIDAAIIATPSDTHLALGLRLIEAGKHVLIEKPLAASVVDAERLVAAARDAGVTLMVGHVERFNPAVLELDHIVQRDQLVHLSTARISAFTERVAIGVVLDLLVHDLDLVCSIVRAPVTRVSAVTQQVRSEAEDLASVVLLFDNGVTADLSVSRVGQQKIRTLAITQRDSYVSVDLLRQNVTIDRVNASEFVEESAGYRETGSVEIPFLESAGEPLGLEQLDFVRAISTATPPRVTGKDGVEALRLAFRVLATATAGVDIVDVSV